MSGRVSMSIRGVARDAAEDGEISVADDRYSRAGSHSGLPLSAASKTSFDSSITSRSAADRSSEPRRRSRSPRRQDERRHSPTRQHDRNGDDAPRRSADDETAGRRREYSPEASRKRKAEERDASYGGPSHKTLRTDREYERDARDGRRHTSNDGYHGKRGPPLSPPRSTAYDRYVPSSGYASPPRRPARSERQSNVGGLPWDEDGRGDDSHSRQHHRSVRHRDAYRDDREMELEGRDVRDRDAAVFRSGRDRPTDRPGAAYRDGREMEVAGRDARDRDALDYRSGRDRPGDRYDRTRPPADDDRSWDRSGRPRDDWRADVRHGAMLPDRPRASDERPIMRPANEQNPYAHRNGQQRPQEPEHTPNGRSFEAGQQERTVSTLHAPSGLNPASSPRAEQAQSKAVAVSPAHQPSEPHASPPPLPPGQTPPPPPDAEEDAGQEAEPVVEQQAPPAPLGRDYPMEDPRDSTSGGTISAESRPLTRVPSPASAVRQGHGASPATIVSVSQQGRHPRRHDPEEDERRYGRKFKGVARLADFDRPSSEEGRRNATLGKGTFGVVTKATRKSDGQLVALKLLQAPQDDSGKVPSKGVLGTTIREIKVLKLLNHPNVVPLLDIVIDKDGGGGPELTFLVFPYMDHDLCGLLKNPSFDRQSTGLLKLYMLQLLEGLAYMHRNNIVHRDLKSANILIDNEGHLQIADFGLARAISSEPIDGSDDRQYTNMVVTRWYRAPELLMGEVQYGAEVDMWSVGCILGEMRTGRVLLQGASDPLQLVAIFDLCGPPPDTYKRFTDELRHMEVTNDNLKEDDRKTIPVSELISRSRPRRLQETLRDDKRFRQSEETFINLIDRLLSVDPKERITADDALAHRFFWSGAGPLDPSQVVSLEASKERRDQQEEQEALHVQKSVARHAQAYAQQSFQPAPPAMMQAYSGMPGGPMPYGNAPVAPNYHGNVNRQQQPGHLGAYGPPPTGPMMGVGNMGVQRPAYPQQHVMPGGTFGAFPPPPGGPQYAAQAMSKPARGNLRFAGNRVPGR